MFLRVRLVASSRLAGATVIAVHAAVALCPLCAHHRAAGATEQAAEREIVTVLHLARLALVLQDLLYLVEQVGRNERFVFAFVHFALPFHDADEEAVGEKGPNGIFRPRLAASRLDAKLEQAS